MQVLITHGSMARSRVLHFSRWQLLLAAAGSALVLMLASGAIYHYFFLQAAREGWPVVSQLVRWVVREDLAQKDRYMRENLDAMARRVGEMQARLVSLQVMGERVSTLAGVKPSDLTPAGPPSSAARGGPFRPAAAPGSIDAVSRMLDDLDAAVALNADIFTLIESRLLETRLQALLVPSSRPVDGPIGSGFGFRYDPFHGRSALHTGLDFPAPTGTPILAAAGGVVVSIEQHPEYGTLLTLDHGGELSTRYAHLSRARVSVGDLVQRRQHIADVGNSGRSTGPHLHFEVLVQGVPQNPARFLAGTGNPRVLN